jgi:hypothetical protein
MNAAQRSPRSLRLTLLAAACALPLFTLGACSRAHITPSHGRAYHQAFAIQDANPNRGKATSIHGLDSQEAAIIAGSYRKALSPKAESTGNNGQLLMVNPNHGGGGGEVAPSVPPGS